MSEIMSHAGVTGVAGVSGVSVVSVVIVSFNTRDLTLAAVASARASRGVHTDVWVVDNASADGSAAAVRAAHPDVHVVELDGNVGFGRGNNAALGQVEAPYVLLLNSDATFASVDGLARLVAYLADRPRVGVVAPRLQGPGGGLEYSARALPSVAGELARVGGVHHMLPRAVRERLLGAEFRDHGRVGAAGWLTGACLLVRREVFEQVGAFDPAIFLYGEELEWCWRVGAAGWELHLLPEVVVVHRRGASSDGGDGGDGGEGGDRFRGADAARASRVEAWKTRLAMAGDAYSVRKHRGWLYLYAFTTARVVALLADAVGQGLAGLLPGQGARRRRARHAARGLRAWLSALARGGATAPAGPRLQR